MTSALSTHLQDCRSCANVNLEPVLKLGSTPLANSLLTFDRLRQPEPAFPLEVVFCASCGLLQINETVSPKVLFSEYVYRSSVADTVVQNAREIAKRLIESRGLGQNQLVVEVASNDGYLLRHYRDAGINVLGIEPAVNIAKIARAEGIPTICRFFGEELAQEMRTSGTVADVIHANNVLAHVADLNGVVAGMAHILKPTGLLVIEVPYVKKLVEELEFDTIYHEHLCYFSLTALDALFSRHGLVLVDVETLPIHGGSLRLFAAHNGTRNEAVRSLLAAERGAGVDQVRFYSDFGKSVTELKEKLRRLLATLKTNGNSIAAYGASAKGSTLLNYFGIGRETLDFIADRSTLKQGLYTPGTHLPIVPTDLLVTRRPDYVLLLSWNFAEEILAQQTEYLTLGGRFIVPIPEPRIV